ncbi:MAG: carbonic anhydrase [bacterium]
MSHEQTGKLSVILLCIDYRFWPHALPLLEKKYGLFDLIEIAGASKSLVSPLENEDRVTLLENIGISVKLHHPERLVLTNHTDCGAYGGSNKFTSHDEEIAFHTEELHKAKVIAQEKFPELKVETLIIDKNEKDEILLIEV